MRRIEFITAGLLWLAAAALTPMAMLTPDAGASASIIAPLAPAP